MDEHHEIPTKHCVKGVPNAQKVLTANGNILAYRPVSKTFERPLVSDQHHVEAEAGGALRSQPIPAARPSRSRPAGALRLRIMEVATELFATRGFGSTSMREVAMAAGCTKPALYYHFDNKAELFLAIIREETERLQQLVNEHLGAPGPLKARLYRSMSAYIEHVRQEPLTLSVLIRAELHTEHGQPTFDFRSVREMFHDTMLKVLREAVENGEIRHGVILDDVLAALIGMVDYRTTLWLVQGEAIPDDYPDRVLSLLFGGLAP